MKTKFKGTLVRKFPARTFPKSGARSREFWCREIDDSQQNTDDSQQYENILPFEIFSSAKAKSDFTAVLDSIDDGSVVSFDFSVRGREWKDHDKLFVALRVSSKIDTVSAPEKARRAPAPATPPAALSEPDTTDMPF